MKKILIVEDIDINIDLLTQILEDEYQLIVAKDGPQALESTALNNPDLVLMDISLPIMDGYEAASILRRKYPSLPVIGLSAHAMSGDAEKAIRAGCSDYLTKPVDESLLLQKIRVFLENDLV